MTRERYLDRIRLTDRLLHPWRTARAAALAAADTRDALEVEEETRAAARAERSCGGRRLAWLVSRQARAARAALGYRGELSDIDEHVYRLGARHRRRYRRWRGSIDITRGEAVTARDAERQRAIAHETIMRDHDAGLTLHATRLSRVAAVVGYALLLADALALLSVFAFLLNLDFLRPDPADLITAVALSVFGAGVQAELAVLLGSRLWAVRSVAATDVSQESRQHAGLESPPRSWVVGMLSLLLALTSVLTAASIFARIMVEGGLADASALAAVLGATLAGAALAAPWIIVAQRAFDGSVLTRRLGHLSEIVSHHHWLRKQLRRRAIDAESRAAQLRTAVVGEGWRNVRRAGAAYRVKDMIVLSGRALAGAEAGLSATPATGDTAPMTALPVRVPADLRHIADLLAHSAALKHEIERARSPHRRGDVDLAA